MKSATTSNISYVFFIEQFIPLALVEYEMIIANSTQYAPYWLCIIFLLKTGSLYNTIQGIWLV